MEVIRPISKKEPAISVEIRLPANVDRAKVNRAVREVRKVLRRFTDEKIEIRYKYRSEVL